MAAPAVSTRPGRIWKGNGAPSTLPPETATQLQNGDEYRDYTNKLTYARVNKAWVLDAENPSFKPKGDTGATGAPGSSAIWCVTPDDYGAVHAATTFAGAGRNQTYIDANFPGIGATTTDCIDWACWQMAINAATSTGKTLKSYGIYYIHKGITIPKVFESLCIEGGYAKILSINNNTFTRLGRIAPSVNEEALGSPGGVPYPGMVSSKISVKNLQFGALGNYYNQICFEPGPSYNAYYEGVVCEDAGQAMIFRFCLNTKVISCESVGCKKGFNAGCGNWTGADYTNSQSNVTVFENCRCYMPPGFDLAGDDTYAFAFDGVSGCQVNNCIIEGAPCTNGIKFDSHDSPVVYSFFVNNLHFEANAASGSTGRGANNAAIKLYGRAGVCEINGIFGQYPCIMVDAEASVSCWSVRISNYYWWMGTNGGNKMFRSRGSNMWFFDWFHQDAMGGDNGSTQLPPNFGNLFITDNGTGGTVGQVPVIATLGSWAQGGAGRYTQIPNII